MKIYMKLFWRFYIGLDIKNRVLSFSYLSKSTKNV